MNPWFVTLGINKCILGLTSTIRSERLLIWALKYAAFSNGLLGLMSSMSQSSSHSKYISSELWGWERNILERTMLSLPYTRLQRSGLSTLKCFRLLSWTAFMLSAWPVRRGFSTSAPQKDPRREADYSDNGHLRTSMSSSCVKCLVSSSFCGYRLHVCSITMTICLTGNLWNMNSASIRWANLQITEWKKGKSE